MALSTGVRLDVGTRADARSRLLGELAGTPARKGYGIAYDLLGNRAEAEEAVQDALARACESIGDLRDPAAAPAGFLRIATTAGPGAGLGLLRDPAAAAAWFRRTITTQSPRNLPRRRLKGKLLGWWPGAT